MKRLRKKRTKSEWERLIKECKKDIKECSDDEQMKTLKNRLRRYKATLKSFDDKDKMSEVAEERLKVSKAKYQRHYRKKKKLEEEKRIRAEERKELSKERKAVKKVLTDEEREVRRKNAEKAREKRRAERLKNPKREWRISIFIDNEWVFDKKHTPNKEKAFQYFADLKRSNLGSCEIPRLVMVRNGKQSPMKCECIMMKEVGEDEYEQIKSPYLRNEYGEMVEHVSTNNKKWVIWDKFPYEEEERYSVNGYDHRKDKKDFTFIWNEVILPMVSTEYDFIDVKTLHNKIVLFQHFKPFRLITTKNKDEAIRLYNHLQQKVVKEKLTKFIIFTGECSKKNRTDLYQQISDVTGYSINTLRFKHKTV